MECKVVELEINSSKTKFLARGEATKEILVENLTINYFRLQIVEGQTISFDKRFEKEIEQRISNAWKFFRLLKVVFRSKLGLEKRIKIIDSVVIPILSDGAQTWYALRHF